MTKIEQLVLQGDLAAVHRQLSQEGYDPETSQQLIAVLTEIASLPTGRILGI